MLAVPAGFPLFAHIPGEDTIVLDSDQKFSQAYFSP